MAQQRTETVKQRKSREAREARQAEAAAILALETSEEADEDQAVESGVNEDVPESTVDDDQGDAPEETPVSDDEVGDADEVSEEAVEDIDEGDREFMIGATDFDLISTPDDFEVVVAESVIDRDGPGTLSGETPVKYRGVIEFNPPRIGSRKNPETGKSDINRIEFFFNDPHVFIWLHNRVSRGMPDHTHPDIVRAEAVILEPGSTVIWKDLNTNERD